MSHNIYRQTGCNRGGTEHIRQLVTKLPRDVGQSLSFELTDRDGERAVALAPTLSEQGLSVTTREATAPQQSPVTIDSYAIDHVRPLRSVFEAPVTSSLVLAPLLVSVPTIDGVGGVVVGFSATVTPNATREIDAADKILQRFEALAPDRQSSAHMARYGVHAEQMPRARRAAHDRLTQHSVSYLTTNQVEAELAVVDGFTGVPYQVSVIEARLDDRRRGLREAALNDILPRMAGNSERRGVVFYNHQDPWMYVVLGRQGTNRWRLDRTIQIPEADLTSFEEPAVEPAQEERLPRRKTFVTD